MNPQTMTDKPQIIRFDRDTTFRLACRETDILLCLRTDMFSSKVKIVDFWHMQPGNHVTITNRFDDLPVWFTLCAYEVYNTFAYRLLEWKKAGNTIPMDPTSGPNIWRVLAGDRIVWIGDDRPEYTGVDGILRIFDFRECALAAGETGNNSIESILSFGTPPENLGEKRTEQFRSALIYVAGMGIPRSVSMDGWGLG